MRRKATGEDGEKMRRKVTGLGKFCPNLKKKLKRKTPIFYYFTAKIITNGTM